MPRKKKLRTGFTTGTSAAAGAKAALTLLLSGQVLEKVPVNLPGGGELAIPLECCEKLSPRSAAAKVIKDGGDDPDVTHKAAIRALVELADDTDGPEEISITGGEGVGTVTRPGLDLAVGEPAINPVPRKMIAKAVREAWEQSGRTGAPRVKVTISVPRGLDLAKHTLNPRLGIEGGISILGTTGLVKPFSHEAYTATIESGLKVARAAGLEEIVLTTGRRSEKRAMALRPDLPDTRLHPDGGLPFLCPGALRPKGHDQNRAGVLFRQGGVKQAQALPCTHAHQAPMDLARLAEWLRGGGASPGLCAEVAGANTARHALEVMREYFRLDLCALVGEKALSAMRNFAGPTPEVWCVVMDYDYSILFKGRLEPGGERLHA